MIKREDVPPPVDDGLDGGGDGGGEAPTKKGPPPPNRVAEEICRAHRLVTDAVDTVWRYDDASGCWRELGDPALRALAMRQDGARHTSGRRRSEIVSFIKASTFLEGLRWGRVADYEVAARNGVVDVRTGIMRPHDPDDFLERTLPWSYSPAAPCEVWIEALETWFGSIDAPEVTALQEFFGYVVLSHAKYKKALYLYGPSDAGKSIPLYVLMQMVGEDGTCNLPVEDMDDPVRRAVLRGKLLNVITELSTDAPLADGGFKALVSTEEPILIDEKYKKAEMYIPRAKHVISANTLLRINDKSEGVLNRLLIVPFTRAIPKEKQRESLKAELLREMLGIICWAVNGARALVELGGKFSHVPAAEAMLTELREGANPVLGWLKARCVPEPSMAIALRYAATDFNQWNAGAKRTTTNGFGKLCRAAGLVTKNVRHPERQGVHMSLVGWKLLPDDDAGPTSCVIDPRQVGEDVLDARLPSR